MMSLMTPSRLISAFLTLDRRLLPNLSKNFSELLSGLGSSGTPVHKVAQLLFSCFGKQLLLVNLSFMCTVYSGLLMKNSSGRPSPLMAAHRRRDHGGRITDLRDRAGLPWFRPCSRP